MNLQIPLQEVLFFLKSAWKIITLSVILGCGISSVYLMIAPNQYQAVASIVMGKVFSEKNPLGVDIEHPAELIVRLKNQTSFNESVIQACGLESISNNRATLFGVVELTVLAGTTSLVELKVKSSSPQLALSCASSVYDQILESQAIMMVNAQKLIDDNARNRLLELQQLINEDTILLRKFSNNQYAAVAYLSLLADIRKLESEKAQILKALNGQYTQSAKLQSPIYVGDKPVQPRSFAIFVASLLGSLLLGLFIALWRLTLMSKV